MINLIKGALTVGIGFIAGAALINAMEKNKKEETIEDICLSEVLDEETLMEIENIKTECRKNIFKHTIFRFIINVMIPLFIWISYVKQERRYSNEN